MVNREYNGSLDLHDWEITGILVRRRSQELIVYLFYPGNHKYCDVVFGDVSKSLVTGMAMQNIILDCIVLDASDPEGYYSYCLDKIEFDPTTHMKSGHNYKLIYFEPTIGAEIIVICDKYYIETYEKEM